MKKPISQIIAEELGTKEEYVANVMKLLDEQNTLPFIARYRKEMHGGMDDTTLRTLYDRLKYLENLEERREEVKRSIENQGKLTDELVEQIDGASTLVEVEDLYRPYKQKRRTRATIAKEKGLEMLALVLYSQSPNNIPEVLAQKFIDPEKEVNTVEEALAGASDIIAETISDDAEIRKELRELAMKRGAIETKVTKEKKDEESVYGMYYDFSLPVSKMTSHRVLAVNRAEREKYLTVSLLLDENEGISVITRRVIKKESPARAFVLNAVTDSYTRLIFPSLEREIRSELTDAANEEAIRNFALNLKPLLMQRPVKGHTTMGLDPGYRMGCKVAVIDKNGKVLDTSVVYPTYGERQKQEAISKLSVMIKKWGVTHIAIGNGTASRETEQMAAELIKKVNAGVSYAIVNEAGASVYSVSKLAAEEFPDYDVNLRSAVSIARRLQDPLAELVKIDPKAIGVGQYQHDMPQKQLDDTLAGVVEDCVNSVGVDLNTASPSLLKQVAGVTAATAKNIVAYRDANGGFSARRELLKVPKLGPKAFEQCAGFLRVPESKYALDNTGVHPESYEACEKMLKLCGFTLSDIGGAAIKNIQSSIKSYGKEKLAEECGIGAITLDDIVKELLKPGRDPRDDLPEQILKSDVLEISDLKPGMILNGTVRNVIDFGVFVDIGVHQDGLVHISKVCDRYIKHPSEVVKVGDVVKVIVLEVDEKRKRISLSMRDCK